MARGEALCGTPTVVTVACSLKSGVSIIKHMP